MPGLGRKLQIDGRHFQLPPIGGTPQRESDLGPVHITAFNPKPPTPQPSITTVVSITSASEPSANAPSESPGSPLRGLSLPSVGSQLGDTESTQATQVPSTSSLALIASSLALIANGSPSSMSSGFSNPPESASILPELSTPSITMKPNSSSIRGSTFSTSASTSGSSGSSTPVAAPTTSNVHLNGLIIAVIIISILVLLASIALGVRYFIRRHRQREIARRVESVDPISATMNQIRSSSTSTVSSMMTSGNVTSTNALTIVGGLSEPNRFASPPSSPIRVKLVTHDVPDVYASSQTTADLKYPDAVARTAAITSPAPSPHNSPSVEVPFFYHLRAMRRRGELCKAPTIEPRGVEYIDSDSCDTHPTRLD
ncbi:hypothetical protein JB92DRAFT_2884101 [Gautieria morchelliformis]|nr:hypothetical protein JB92DRAFT_2884101 [Gautieria morchelliformis]